MHRIGLMVTPGGNGYETIEVASGYTIAQLVESHDLFGRTIAADGVEISPEAFKTTVLDGVSEIWATGGAKGA